MGYFFGALPSAVGAAAARLGQLVVASAAVAAPERARKLRREREWPAAAVVGEVIRLVGAVKIYRVMEIVVGTPE